MSDTPPNQSCSQTWINSSFMKNHLCSTGHFAIKGCLKRTSAPHQDTCARYCYFKNVYSYTTTLYISWVTLRTLPPLQTQAPPEPPPPSCLSAWLAHILDPPGHTTFAFKHRHTSYHNTQTHSRHSCLSEPTFNHSTQQGIDCVYDINVVRVCPAAPLPLC